MKKYKLCLIVCAVMLIAAICLSACGEKSPDISALFDNTAQQVAKTEENSNQTPDVGDQTSQNAGDNNISQPETVDGTQPAPDNGNPQPEPDDGTDTPVPTKRYRHPSYQPFYYFEEAYDMGLFDKDVLQDIQVATNGGTIAHYKQRAQDAVEALSAQTSLSIRLAYVEYLQLQRNIVMSVDEVSIRACYSDPDSEVIAVLMQDSRDNPKQFHHVYEIYKHRDGTEASAGITYYVHQNDEILFWKAPSEENELPENGKMYTLVQAVEQEIYPKFSVIHVLSVIDWHNWCTQLVDHEAKPIESLTEAQSYAMREAYATALNDAGVKGDNKQLLVADDVVIRAYFGTYKGYRVAWMGLVSSLDLCVEEDLFIDNIRFSFPYPASVYAWYAGEE